MLYCLLVVVEILVAATLVHHRIPFLLAVAVPVLAPVLASFLASLLTVVLEIKDKIRLILSHGRSDLGCSADLVHSRKRFKSVLI